MPSTNSPITPLEAATAAMQRSVMGEEICTDSTDLAEPTESDTPDRADLSDFIEVSGLLEYDPAAISRIYAGAPQRLIRRIWQTLVPIGLYLVSVAIDWLTRRLANPDHARARAKEAADLVASLGPAFIKAGQALSTRPDIVPPLLLEELAGLQDQLPGFDSALAMACIEDDLGAPIASIYAELEREPISAASLGQVHRGVLLNGEKVAVKVQRPGLREQITRPASRTTSARRSLRSTPNWSANRSPPPPWARCTAACC